MGNKIALGQASPAVSKELVEKPVSIEERLHILEQRLTDIAKAMFAELEAERRPDLSINGESVAKPTIPVGTCLMGITRNQPYWLTVEPDGFYVGARRYNSLSAAAEAVSGVRRSGWTFWCTADGKTAKEVFGK